MDWADKALSTGVSPIQNAYEPERCFNTQSSSSSTTSSSTTSSSSTTIQVSTKMISPCVAVIDEDSESSSNNTQEWLNFRTEYPDRPFCLLLPNRIDKKTVSIPVVALSDPNFQFHNITQVYSTENWFSLCGFDKMNSSNVQSIGLFIDRYTSTSSLEMDKNTVAVSYKKFLADAARANIKVCEVYDRSKKWIKHFMNTLSPNMLSCTGPAPVSYDCLPTDACTCNDNDKCTSDVLDPASGLCSYNPISCPESQSCDPVDG
jgi:hypothetical protein